MPAANATVTSVPLAGPSARRLGPRRNGRRNSAPQNSRRHYRPYHPHGEAVVLILAALAGTIWLIMPFGFWIHLFGSILFFLVLPATVLRIYWPGLRLHDLGWNLPVTPARPLAYGLVVVGLCFLPLIIFLSVQNPGAFVAVHPNSPWVAWLIAEALVSLLFLAQAAFFCGLVLFRLTHLLPVWAALTIVAVILTVTQFFLPGTIGVFSLPLSFAFVWIAWQAKSFVPVAILQFLLSLTYDLIVKLS